MPTRLLPFLFPSSPHSILPSFISVILTSIFTIFIFNCFCSWSSIFLIFKLEQTDTVTVKPLNKLTERLISKKGRSWIRNSEEINSIQFFLFLSFVSSSVLTHTLCHIVTCACLYQRSCYTISPHYTTSHHFFTMMVFRNLH